MPAASFKPQMKPDPGIKSEADRVIGSILGGYGKVTGNLIRYTIAKVGIPGVGGIKEAIDWISHPDQEMKKWFHQETGIPSLDAFQLAGKTASLVGSNIGRAVVHVAYPLASSEVMAILAVDKTKEFDALGTNVPKYVFNKAWDWVIRGEIVDSIVSPLRWLGATAFENVYVLPDSAFDRAGNLIHQPRNFGAPDYRKIQIPKAVLLRDEAHQAANAGRNGEARWKNFLANLSSGSLFIQSAWPGRLISGGLFRELGYDTVIDHAVTQHVGWQKESGNYLNLQGEVYRKDALNIINPRGRLGGKGDINGYKITSNREYRWFGGRRVDGFFRFTSDFLSVPGILDAVLTGNNLRKWAFVRFNADPNGVPALPIGVANSRYVYSNPNFDRNKFKIQNIGGKNVVLRVGKQQPISITYSAIGTKWYHKAFYATDVIRKLVPAGLVVAGAVTLNPIIIGAGLLKINESLGLLEDLKYLGWVHLHVPSAPGIRGISRFSKIDDTLAGKIARGVYLLTHPFILDSKLYGLAGKTFQGSKIVYGWIGKLPWYQAYLQSKALFNKAFFGRLQNFYDKKFLFFWDNNAVTRWIADVAWPVIMKIYPVQLAVDAFGNHGIFGALGKILGMALLPLIGLYFTFGQLNNALNNILQNQLVDRIFRIVLFVPLLFWSLLKPLLWKISTQFGWQRVAGWLFRRIAGDGVSKFLMRLGGGNFQSALSKGLRDFLRWLFRPFTDLVKIYNAGVFVWNSVVVPTTTTIWSSVVTPSVAFVSTSIFAPISSAIGGAVGGVAAALGVTSGVVVALAIIVIIGIILWLIAIFMIIFMIILPLVSIFSLNSRFTSPPSNNYLLVEKSVTNYKANFLPGDEVDYQIRYKVLKPMNDGVVVQDYFLVQGKDSSNNDLYYFDPNSISCDDPLSNGGIIRDNDPEGPTGTYYRWGATYANPDPGFDAGTWKTVNCKVNVDSRYTSGVLFNHAIVIGYVKGTTTFENRTVSAKLFLNTGGDIPSGWPVPHACIFQGPNSPSPYSHSYYINHEAVDLADNGGANLGAPIFSTSNGTVLGVQKDGTLGVCGSAGFGNCVIVQSGEFKILYAHMFSVAGGIVTGSVVNRGQQIGSVGWSGTFPPAIHVHYGFVTSSGKILDTPYIPFHVPGCVDLVNTTDPSLGCQKMLQDLGYSACF